MKYNNIKILKETREIIKRTINVESTYSHLYWRKHEIQVDTTRNQRDIIKSVKKLKVKIHLFRFTEKRVKGVKTLKSNKIK